MLDSTHECNKPFVQGHLCDVDILIELCLRFAFNFNYVVSRLRVLILRGEEQRIKIH